MKAELTKEWCMNMATETPLPEQLDEVGWILAGMPDADFLHRAAREIERLRAELLREHADHQETLRDVDAMVAAERERCAKIAGDNYGWRGDTGEYEDSLGEAILRPIP